MNSLYYSNQMNFTLTLGFMPQTNNGPQLVARIFFPSYDTSPSFDTSIVKLVYI